MHRRFYSTIPLLIIISKRTFYPKSVKGWKGAEKLSIVLTKSAVIQAGFGKEVAAEYNKYANKFFVLLNTHWWKI